MAITKDKTLRLKKLMERELDPRELEIVSGGGMRVDRGRGSRYCTLTDPT